MIAGKKIALVCTFLLAGCGGGGGGDLPPRPVGTAEGLWLGTTNTNRTVTGLVLDDASYLFIYSAVSSPNVAAGFVQGNASSFNGVFSSANARDFNLEGLGILTATISGSYVNRQSLNGTLTYTTAGTTTFTSTFSTNYDTTPTIAAIAGTYSGATAAITGPTPTVDFASMTIASDGTLSGSGSSGCTFTGSATPRTKGNAYVVSLAFGAAPCVFAGQTFTAIGYFDAAKKALYAAAPDSARTSAVFFLGTKP